MGLKNELAWIIRRRLLPKPAKYSERTHTSGNVYVAGLFSTANGIGRSARLHYQALQSSGVDCKAIDLSAFFGVADMNSDIPDANTIPKDGAGTLILCLNPLEAEAALYSHHLRNAKKWRIIGNWVWELPKAPRNWKSKAKYFTEIWVPSEFIRRGLGDIENVPIKVVPLCPQLPEHIREQETEAEFSQSVRFLIAADGWSSFERKNVLGGIDAYKQAFPQVGAGHLTVKCRNLEAQPEFHRRLVSLTQDRKDIDVLLDTLTDEEMQTLVTNTDAVISLHRSEGFGLVLAEAMLQGKAVIATNWSGNLQFMSEDNAYLIDCDLVPVNDPFGVYTASRNAVWADADVHAAAEAIRTVASNAELRTTTGLRGREKLALILHPTVVARALGANASE